MGWVSSCETGPIPRCRSRSGEEKAIPHTRNGLRGWASRSLRPHARGEVLCTEPGRPHPCPAGHAGPAHEGKSRTMSMHADEESDEGVVPMKRSNNEGVSSAETVEGRTRPRGTAVRRPRPGHCAGIPRRSGWQPCAKRRDRARQCGSPRCCITSPSICSDKATSH